MALVIDASAMVIALLGRSDEAAALRGRLVAEVCHAPHLIDAEVGNLLRQHVLRGGLAAADAAALLHFSGPLVDHRHQMTGALATAARGAAPERDLLRRALRRARRRARRSPRDRRPATGEGARPYCNCVVEQAGLA